MIMRRIQCSFEGMNAYQASEHFIPKTDFRSLVIKGLIDRVRSYVDCVELGAFQNPPLAINASLLEAFTLSVVRVNPVIVPCADIVDLESEVFGSLEDCVAYLQSDPIFPWPVRIFFPGSLKFDGGEFPLVPCLSVVGTFRMLCADRLDVTDDILVAFHGW